MPDPVSVEDPAAQLQAAVEHFLECITRGPGEPAGPEFLAVCDNNPVHITCSRFCPSECGGHPVCDPCYRLGLERGLIKPEKGGQS